VDVYNDGDSDATLTIRSPEIREVSYTIKPRELRRLRTGWRDTSSKVIFAFTPVAMTCSLMSSRGFSQKHPHYAQPRELPATLLLCVPTS
jgi:hypothetical protein